MRYIFILALVIAFGAAGMRTALAEDFVFSLQDHKFNPLAAQVPAYVKVTIIIDNLDVTAAEIGSAALKMDPVLVEPKSRLEFVVGPLNPGTYDFFDAFHNDTEFFVTAR